MVDLDVGLEGNVCELGLASVARYHRDRASYLAIPLSAFLVSLHLASHGQVAHYLVPRRDTTRLCGPAGSYYWFRCGRISHGLPPPPDSRCEDHHVRGA